MSAQQKLEDETKRVINQLTDESNAVTNIEVEREVIDVSGKGPIRQVLPGDGQTITIELNGGA